MSRQKQIHDKRRLQNAYKEKYRAQVEEERSNLLVANWEHRSDRMIERRLAQNSRREEQEKKERALNARRRKLKALLDSEFYALQSELKNSFETMDQRRERLVREAAKLQEDRERQRLETVERLREQQWIQSVDQIRTHRSKLISAKIAEDRLSQLREANLRLRREAEEETRFAKMADERRLKMLEREIEEAKDLKRRNEEMKRILRRQVVEREAVLDREEEILIEEAKRLKARWKREAEADVARERARRDRAAQIERDVARFNQHKNAIDSKRDSEERALDAKLLKAALEKEAQAIQKEIELKKARRAEMIEYQQALKEQMIKEVEDNTYLEKLLKEESDKEWDKREARWNAEADARKRLLNEVDRSRRAQIEAKHQRKLDERDMDMAWARKAKEDMRKADEREKEESRKRRDVLRRNCEFLNAQIEDRKQRRQDEMEKELRKLELEKEAELAYQKKFDTLFEDYKLEKQDYRRKKVQWYY